MLHAINALRYYREGSRDDVAIKDVLKLLRQAGLEDLAQ